jgi:ribosome maturation factor RimP
MQKETLVKLVESWMEGTPFFLVDINLSANNDIEIAFESSTDVIDIEDCVSLSHYLESNLDRNVEDYSLEVGSAGLGQPFKVIKQYEKCLGLEVNVLPKSGKKQTGVLLSVDDQEFQLEVVRKVKTEAAKRPVLIKETLTFKHVDVKHVSEVVQFS